MKFRQIEVFCISDAQDAYVVPVFCDDLSNQVCWYGETVEDEGMHIFEQVFAMQGVEYATQWPE